MLLLLAASYWSASFPKLLRNDQIIFESVAQGIGETGKPVAHYGRFVNLGMWHPPLLFYEQALWTRLTGSVELGARLPGALGVVLALLLAFWGVRRCAGERAGEAGAFLLLACPALMYTAMVPDHDGALVLPACVLLAGIELKALADGRPLPMLPLVGAGFLMFWAKLTTPPLIFVGLVSGSLLLLGWGSGLRAAAAAAIALTLFLASWVLYCAWMRLNPGFILEYMALKMGSRPAWPVRWHALWVGVQELGLPLIALYTVLLARQQEAWRRKGALLLGIQALIPMLAFSLVSSYFAEYPLSWKYVVPSQALLALACALLWPDGDWWPKLNRAEKGSLLILSVLTLVQLWQPRSRSLLPTPVAAGFMLLLAFWAWTRRGRGGAARFAAGNLLLMVLLQGWVMGNLTEMGEDSPPEFPTGEQGYAAVVAELQGPEYRDRSFLCRKDIGFYAPGKRVVPIDPHFRRSPRPLDIPVGSRPFGTWLKSWWPFAVDDWTVYSSWERAYVNDPDSVRDALDEVDTVVDSDYDSFLADPGLRRLVETRYRKRKEIGHYSIYVKRSPGDRDQEAITR